MSEITNKLNLPKTVVKAAKAFQHDYSSSRGATDVSVTQLIRHPMYSTLKELYNKRISVDVSDLLYSLHGSALHLILEKAEPDEDDDWIKEVRYFAEIAGCKVSGQVDLIEDHKVLSDYKETSTYKVKDVQEEWIQQLNVNKYLAEESDKSIKIEKLQIVAFLRDWSKAKLFREPNYPTSKIFVIDIPVWPKEQTKKYIETRVKLHMKYRNATEGLGGTRLKDALSSMEVCSPEERYHKPDKWAVTKPGAARATRVLESAEEAEKYKKNHKDSKILVIEFRRGEDTKCEYYCDGNAFCPHYKKIKKEKEEKKVDE